MRRPLATTAVALACAALAGPASARIVAQRSIMGVTLGMAQSDVRQKLGKPDATGQAPNEFAGDTYTVFRYGGTRIFLYDRRVAHIRTTTRSERTATGVGVGSTRRQVLAGVRGSRCRVEFGLDHCWVGEWRRAGRKVTDFTISSRTGRVTSVFLGYVQD